MRRRASISMLLVSRVGYNRQPIRIIRDGDRSCAEKAAEWQLGDSAPHMEETSK